MGTDRMPFSILLLPVVRWITPYRRCKTVHAAAGQISKKHKHAGPAEGALLGTPLCPLVQDGSVLLDPIAKASKGMVRVVLHDSVQMSCVHIVRWTIAIVLRMLRELGLVMADQVVHEVKAATENGDTDLRSPAFRVLHS